jgi:valyl-tRNA synthetase
LSNERFVSNAKPEVVAMEQKKRQDALQRIQVLKEQLEALV